MDNIIYTINRSSIKDVFSHLQKVSEQFSPSLDSRVNLDSYAEKIGKKAFRFEAWSNDWLIGLVACYVDEKKMIAYITNVSVEQDYQHIGIASKLLYSCLEMTGQKSVRQIKLQVYQSNDKAISLYTKMGFVVCGGDNDLYEMQLNKEKSEIVVSVCCLVYNHAPYLRECFEGFVMQKTNFPIEILVHDDASTDGSQEIIKEYTAKYPTLFKPIYQKENQYSKGIGVSVTYQFPRAKGKYIALCEGDDYWTDPYKLQKQVDFLENNHEYSMCFHQVNVIENGKTQSTLFSNLEAKDYTAREIYENWTVPTCSVLFCTKMFNVKSWGKSVYFGDIVVFLNLAERGKLHCLDLCGATYRRHQNGVSMHLSVSQCCKLANQYKYMGKRFRQLKDISCRKESEVLDAVIYAPYFVGQWRYRFRYMVLHKRLFFSSFLTTTILSYTMIRNLKKCKK